MYFLNEKYKISTFMLNCNKTKRSIFHFPEIHQFLIFFSEKTILRGDEKNFFVIIFVLHLQQNTTIHL